MLMLTKIGKTKSSQSGWNSCILAIENKTKRLRGLNYASFAVIANWYAGICKFGWTCWSSTIIISFIWVTVSCFNRNRKLLVKIEEFGFLSITGVRQNIDLILFTFSKGVNPTTILQGGQSNFRWLWEESPEGENDRQTAMSPFKLRPSYFGLVSWSVMWSALCWGIFIGTPAIELIQLLKNRRPYFKRRYILLVAEECASQTREVVTFESALTVK